MRIAIPALAALTLVAALLRLPWLTAEGLWFDEVYSVVVALQDAPDVVLAARADQTNPPGFYLLLWGWMQVGAFDEAWLRLLPALAGILTPAAVALLARELGGRWLTALLAGMLAAASPLLIAMSLEVRAYATLALAATAGLILALRLARHADATIPWSLVITLAMIDAVLVSLHYFGALAILAQVAVLVDIRVPAGRRPAVARALVFSALPAVLLLGGWLATVIGAAPEGQLFSHVTWIQESGWRDVIRFAGHHAIGDLGYGVAAVLLALIAATAVALPLVTRGRAPAGTASGARVAALATILPIATVLVAEALTPRALWVPRYLIGAVTPLIVAVALLGEFLGERLGARARVLFSGVIASWALLAGLHDIRSRPQKPDWARVLAELARGAPTTVCVNEPFVGLPLEYYALRDRLPVRVLDMRACERGAERTWAVYQTGAESSLDAVVSRGGRPGPPLSLLTEKPPTKARRVDWTRGAR